jgi:thiol-disulfide isomerase/thioredoxin
VFAVSCAADDGDDGDGVAAEASFDVVPYNNEEVFGGSEVDFTSVLGNGTPVVLNFWAALCPPCLTEMPWLQAASERYDGEVLLVGVDVGPFTGLGNNEQGADLLDSLSITYPAAYAVDDTALREFEVISMPTTVFFDGEGSIVETHSGILVESQIDDWFSRLAEGES